MRALALWLLLLGACTRREPAHQATEPSSAADVSASGRTSSAPQRPAAPLAVGLSVEQSPHGLGLHVLNRGQGRVSLAPAVAALRRDGSLARGEALRLRLDCQQQGCVELDPGGELLAPCWLGQLEAERCDALFRPEQAGEYELVVKTCDGAREARVAFRWDAP